MKSKIAISLLVIVVAVSMVVGGTMAYFKDTEVNTGTITSGVLNVEVNGGSKAIDLTSFKDFEPGQIMDQPASIVIKNSGNINLAWFGNVSATGDEILIDNIYVDSMQMEFLSPDNKENWETTDLYVSGGQPVGPWKDLTLLDDVKNIVTLRKLMVNVGMAAGYQNMGALKPGYSYRLTIKLGLLPSAEKDCMGKTAYITYTADATQVKAAALDSFKAGFGVHYGWLNDQIAKQH